MSAVELGDVIAERTLEARGPGRDAHEVHVRIGRPVPEPRPGGDWISPFQVVGSGDGSVRYACGIDSLQALTLTLRMIQIDLGAAGIVRWINDEDLGFS